jgi:hypothetical protein
MPAMILAGIDEAGYGPLLGPLVVGCSAFAIEAAVAEDIPCLWTRLGRAISKRKTNGKLHVNDSKIVYTPAGGIKELERSVLAISEMIHGFSGDLDSLIQRTASHAIVEIAGYRWYQSVTDESFPIAQEAIGIRIQANALAVEMRRQGIACVHLAARLVCERQFNAMLAATRNKANALFSITAIHLDHLLRTFGQRDLTIVCDRQGGRQHYGSLLRLMFEDWALEVTREIEGHSEYRLSQGGHSVRVIFREKAEEFCMSVAAAAMLSKYLREALMRRFNAFWRSHSPATAPTAGYYTDGLRFLRDIAPRRMEMGIPEEELVRCR